jgi:predicted DNA-binding transcriptional regulator AlpA
MIYCRAALRGSHSLCAADPPTRVAGDQNEIAIYDRVNVGMERMTKRLVVGPRPPSYVSKSTLAAELDMSESTVDNYVQRGLLPKPIMRGAVMRWCWAEVDAALRQQHESDGDPFMNGLDRV